MQLSRTTDLHRVLPALGILAGCLACGSTARAQSANTSSAQGAAIATVVGPVKVTAGAGLRFGQFVSPATAGTITIDPFGTVTTSGGMVGADAFSQTGAGRGNATFAVNGNVNAAFSVKISNNIQLASGANRMKVNVFTGNVVGGAGVLDASGSYTLTVGATLSVNANQPVGSYSGTYSVTVTYQ